MQDEKTWKKLKVLGYKDRCNVEYFFFRFSFHVTLFFPYE